MNLWKTLRENKKMQLFVIFFAIIIIFTIGYRLEAKNLTAGLPFETNAIESIQAEATIVKSTRDDYFHMIGKGNGGAYDEYLNSIDCISNLDLKLISLKNLRNDLRRLVEEVGLRKQELEIRKAIEYIENPHGVF